MVNLVTRIFRISSRQVLRCRSVNEVRRKRVGLANTRVESLLAPDEIAGWGLVKRTGIR